MIEKTAVAALNSVPT